MNHTTLRLTLLAVAVGGLAGCAEADAGATKTAAKPATLVQEGSIKKVVLVEKAAKRIDLQTAPVRDATAPEVVASVGASPAGRTALPYTALLYDKSGATFTYVSSSALEFTHQPVTVERIKNEFVVLTAGPPVGTNVVTRGGAELFGVETGVGK